MRLEAAPRGSNLEDAVLSPVGIAAPLGAGGVVNPDPIHDQEVFIPAGGQVFYGLPSC